jgi:DNA (cytosine-5)-methyltransferase 1
MPETDGCYRDGQRERGKLLREETSGGERGMRKPRVGSIFSGIGGFDKAFQGLGWHIAYQVEPDRFCRELLDREFPEARKFDRVESFIEDQYPTVDLICGGDPCPSRSLAKGNRKSNHPDLSGYFLAVVGRQAPAWVVRENVPAPDVVHFAAALELLGYGVVALVLDAKDFTSQSRRRQFIIGCPPQIRADFERVVFDAADGFGFVASSQCEETPIAACLTAHPARMAAEDSYVYQAFTYCITTRAGHQRESTDDSLYQGGKLRTLSPEECEGLQGFPRGWTTGFSRSRRRIMLGNAVNVKCVEHIGRMILKAWEERDYE